MLNNVIGNVNHLNICNPHEIVKNTLISLTIMSDDDDIYITNNFFSKTCNILEFKLKVLKQ